MERNFVFQSPAAAFPGTKAHCNRPAIPIMGSNIQKQARQLNLSTNTPDNKGPVACAHTTCDKVQLCDTSLVERETIFEILTIASMIPAVRSEQIIFIEKG